MKSTQTRTIGWTAAGIAAGLLAGSPALADDTEVFLGNLAGSEAARPNVLFILDTSRSMNAEVLTVDPPRSRLQIMKDVTSGLVQDIDNVNVGLMRLSSNNEGGMVLHPVEFIDDGRTELLTAIGQLDANVPVEFGFTPLSETLYEAGLYYLGEDVNYGVNSTGTGDGAGGVESLPSVALARTGISGERYLQPDVASSCRKNYVVLLSDGAPTQDLSADSLITALPDFQARTGNAEAACDVIPEDDTAEGGTCLDDMAAYLFNSDVDQGTPGIQNVVTYTIGFGTNESTSIRLERTAQRGGGQAFLVQNFDPDELAAAFSAILTEVREKNTSFTSPAVAVNAFNRTQNLDDLYFAVFKAAARPNWTGNLKKYRFVGGQIVGSDGSTPAVDPDTGFFSATSQSYWSAQPDGFEAAAGGAASRLPGPAVRNLYTFAGNTQISAASNAFIEENVSAEMLGIDPLDEALRSNIINWARGQDVLDEDGDGDDLEARRMIGDPLHSTPAVIVYGGTPGSPDIGDATIYFGTNDGFLHAIDAATGDELFAFVPAELLRNLPVAYQSAVNALTGQGQGLGKAYGLDGAMQVLREDVNGDGIISPGDGDRIVLYFGMRRGEDRDGNSYYYAIDVSDRAAPTLLWVLGPDQLPGLGQTWSTPMLARVDVDGAAQNDNQNVLIFGGGYDTGQDVQAYSADDQGNAVFMVDAISGNLLWSAGAAAPHDLVLPAMVNAIPSNVRVLDLNNDLFADRMYVGDMGGRVWRFDIFNGQARGSLVAGGVMASLGAGDMETPTAADNRRFYNAPDIAFVPAKTGAYLNIAIGSGYRAHPLNQVTAERFYGIRDYNPFNALSQLDYDALAASPIRDDDASLVDVTNDATPLMPAGTSGWKLSLPQEKVLSESRTFAGTVIFTTYTPGGSVQPCEPGQGLNKLYQVSLFDASPVTNLDGIGDADNLSVSDRSRTLAQTGIAPTPTFLFPSPEGGDAPGPDDEGCEGDECACVGDECGLPSPRCLVGLEACDVDFGNPPVRTFWTQKEVDGL